jgi:hypothetical protein
LPDSLHHQTLPGRKPRTACSSPGSTPRS